MIGNGPPLPNSDGPAGTPPDLDHLAALLMQMAGSTTPSPNVASGLTGRSGGMHPQPPSTGANQFETMSLPGNEFVPFISEGLSEGIDPSLVSLDLLPMRRTGRDAATASQIPRAENIERHATSQSNTSSVTMAPSPQGRPGMPANEGPTSLPFDVPAAESQQLPAGGEGYYFVPASDREKTTGTAPSADAAVRKDFPILQQKINGHRLVWLDNGATTQKPEAVIEAEAEYYRNDNSNVHRGAHTLAKRATEAYEQARRKVAGFIGASSMEEIVFVRGTTEGINLIAATLGEQVVGEGDEVVVTMLEHHSNIVPWQMLCTRKRAKLKVVPVDENGDVQLDAFASLLGPRTRIVSMTHVSNVIGTRVPVEAMAAMAHQHGAFVVVDGAQSVAHCPVDVKAMCCDFYVFSGHKVYAPTGIGAVYGRKSILDAMPPYQGGGGMIKDVTFESTVYDAAPMKFEAGTGNIGGAVGLGAALDYLGSKGMPVVAAHEQELVHYAVESLQRVPGLKLLGAPRLRVAALTFTLEGFEPMEVATALDQRGIAVRAGHHCAQPILRRFGLERAVRASLGIYNGADDIDALVAALREIAGKRRPQRA